jgi:hypothetical protein
VHSCDDDQPDESLLTQVLPNPGTRNVRWYHCVRCDTAITPEDAAIHVAGSHEHTFTNPNAVTFHVGCFTLAPGAAPVSADTIDHTWFPGYSWSIVVCRSCSTHLGWRFRGDAGTFHALILDRIRLFGPIGV